MNPGRFFIPNVPSMGMRFSSMPVMHMKPITSKGLGSIRRIGSNLKTFNWTNILSGANKTLNVMNQTIPLIRQTKPMFNNMKSMFKLARAFGNETISRNKNNYQGNSNQINNKNSNNNFKNNKNFSTNYNKDNNNNNQSYKENDKNNNYNYEESNYPTFFV